MTVKQKQEAQQPLILRAHRLMDAFSKSNDERDFYIDRQEGYIIYADLDKSQDDLDSLENELTKNANRYAMIPKLTFYEAKKFMEGFVNEKVYDIDTKEKLLDIIQSKEARANFLEFIYDHLTELEKWQQYYQERSRVRIIEWLRQQHFHFVFEEDLEFTRSLLEKLKQSLFESRVGKDIQTARKILITKAKGYYSNEALNPRPKRGRPPKQIAKQEIEPQITSDIYLTVPNAIRPFLFTPDISSSAALTFSTDFDHGLGVRKHALAEIDPNAASLQSKLMALRQLSSGVREASARPSSSKESDWEEEKAMKPKGSQAIAKTNKLNKTPIKKETVATAPKKKNLRPLARLKKPIPKVPTKRLKHKRIMPTQKMTSKPKPVVKKPIIKAAVKKKIIPNKKAPVKKPATKSIKKAPLRRSR